MNFSEETNNNTKIKRKEKAWFRRLFREFADHTTAHGYGQITFSNIFIVKVFWISVLISCHVFLYFQIRPLVERYISKPTGTKIFLQQEKNPVFPVIVICNQNMIKKDRYEDLWKKVREDMSAHNRTTEAPLTTIASTMVPPTNDTPTGSPTGSSINKNDSYYYSYFGWGESTENIQVEEFVSAKEEFAFVSFQGALSETAKIIGNKIHQFGHPIKELIPSCNWKVLHNCKSPKFWNRFWHWKYGSCYAFNSGFDIHGNETDILKVSRPGPGNALEIKLFINQSQYSTNKSDTAGVRIYIGEQGGLYLPYAEGSSLSPGFSYSIGLRKKLIKRLDPFQNESCIDDTPSVLKNDLGQRKLTKYSTQLCRRKCLAEKQLEKCGCISYYLEQRTTNIETCKWHARSCIDSIEKKWAGDDLPCLKLCTFPCKEIRYETDMSFGYYPIVNARQTIYKNIDKPRDNYLKVSIYLKSLEVEVWEDKMSYALENLLADIGGQLGLFSGYSVLTLIEFAFFLFYIIAHGVYLYMPKNKTQDSDQILTPL